MKDILHIGITGTRSGFNDSQLEVFFNFINKSFEPGAVFHHGDCVGVDVEAALIAKEVGYKIVGHPPIKKELRGFFEDDETRAVKNYLARDRDIVDESFMLVVVPYQMEHQSTGGTWYTHDYAIKKKKPVHVIWPEKK